ncbi:unnamed protein product, partial [Urochloa humidicola]
PLLQLLKHNDVPVREAAAYALEKLSVSSTICQKVKEEGGLELLVNTVKDPNTPVKQLEKIISILSRMFDMGISMVAAPERYAHEDVTSAERSIQGDAASGSSAISHKFENQEMV